MKVSIIQMYEEFVKKKKKFLNFDNQDSFKITFDVRSRNVFASMNDAFTFLASKELTFDTKTTRLFRVKFLRFTETTFRLWLILLLNRGVTRFVPRYLTIVTQFPFLKPISTYAYPLAASKIYM